MTQITNSQKNLHGSVYAIISGLCYGLLGYLGITLINNAHIPLYSMIFWRFLIAGASMFVPIVMFYKKNMFPIRECIRVIVYGIVLYGTSAIAYFYASTRIGTGLAMVIFFTYPVWVLIFQWLMFKQPIKKIYYIATALCLVGMVLLADTSSSSIDFYGIAFGVSSALLYAVYIILSKSDPLHPYVSTSMVSFGCAFIGLAGALTTHTFVIPSTLFAWSFLVLLAVAATSLPIYFFLKSLEYISAEKSSLLSVLEPIFVVFLGVTLLNEKITVIQMIGIFIILSGAIIVFAGDLKTIDKSQSPKELI